MQFFCMHIHIAKVQKIIAANKPFLKAMVKKPTRQIIKTSLQLKDNVPLYHRRT